MPRLFVDCDDTLILWGDSPEPDGLYHGDKYELNVPLMGLISCILDEHREYELVVWSGGGIDYADRWASRCFPERNWSIAAKDMRTPQADDICIDDMYGEMKPRDGRVRVVSPDVSTCPVCR